MAKEKKRIDQGYYIECLERVEMMREITENSLQVHRVVNFHPELKEMGEELQEYLSKMYQFIASKVD